jgi:hypothetical protein
MPRRSIACPVPHQHHVPGLFFNHLQLSHSILPPYHYPPYPNPPPPIGDSLDGNVPPPPPYGYPPYSCPPPSISDSSGVLLLNHICTLHLRHIHTLHLNLFTPEVVTTRVVGTIPLIQLKLLRGQRNEMSGLTVTRKNLILLNFIISLSFI